MIVAKAFAKYYSFSAERFRSRSKSKSISLAFLDILCLLKSPIRARNKTMPMPMEASTPVSVFHMPLGIRGDKIKFNIFFYIFPRKYYFVKT